MGGCIAIPGSCSSGFKSRPSNGAGNKRSKGFDVKIIKSKNPTATAPMILSTRATSSVGKLLLNMATAAVHSDKINAQSRSDPSCEPQTPAIR